MLTRSGILIVCGILATGYARPSNESKTAQSEMRRFIQTLEGTWTINFTVSPSEVLSKGGTGHGEEIWKPGPGGTSFIEEYHSRGDEGEIVGHAIYWWDERLHRIDVLWCANYVPSGCEIISEGAVWDGNNLVLSNQWELGGKRHFVEEVFSDITPSSFVQTIYQGESREKLSVAYVFQANRKSSSIE